MAQEYIALKEKNNDGVIALSTSAFFNDYENCCGGSENLKLAKHGQSAKISIELQNCG